MRGWTRGLVVVVVVRLRVILVVVLGKDTLSPKHRQERELVWFTRSLGSLGIVCTVGSMPFWYIACVGAKCKVQKCFVRCVLLPAAQPATIQQKPRPPVEDLLGGSFDEDRTRETDRSRSIGLVCEQENCRSHCPNRESSGRRSWVSHMTHEAHMPSSRHAIQLTNPFTLSARTFLVLPFGANDDDHIRRPTRSQQQTKWTTFQTVLLRTMTTILP